MTRITHVLCPVDFSPISQHAVDHASAMASWYKAGLTLLYVFADQPTMGRPRLVLEDTDSERLTVALRKMAARVPAEVALDFRVRAARQVHDEILAQLAATRADLLVLGTHGRSGFEPLFLGSVTEKVIRKAACPMLVVPPHAGRVAPDAPVQLRRILCPIDFSESSLDALAHAMSIAEETGARLTLLHVVEIPSALSQEPMVLEVDLPRIREMAVSEARRHLDRLIPEQSRSSCTIETAVVEGRARQEVFRQAAERQSDLIVMGVRGKGGIDRLIFGSTTDHVIRAAACPVLIVRSA